VHALRLIGKLLEHVRASAQPHSDLLRFPKPPPTGRFLLACVGKPIAVTAGEQAPAPYSLVTRRPQYTPFAVTEHTNQGCSPPNRHGVHSMATRCSTSVLQRGSNELVFVWSKIETDEKIDAL
jgi:hypothetical protein